MVTETNVQQNDSVNNHNTVHKVNDQGHFYVESDDGLTAYKVIANDNVTHCTCSDFMSRTKSDINYVCQHINAVRLHKNVVNQVNPKLDERFITRIKDKEFVLYAGLLDLAHQIGLKSVCSKIIQYPTKDNEFTAVCCAHVVTKRGEVYSDIGDANPKNSNKLVVDHIVRVASTRAKARCLRDMTNIGMTCLEELGDCNILDGIIAGAENPLPPVKEKVGAKVAEPMKSHSDNKVDKGSDAPQPNQKPASPITNAQVKAIQNIAKRKKIDDQKLQSMIFDRYQKKNLRELSSSIAAKLIHSLQKAA